VGVERAKTTIALVTLGFRTGRLWQKVIFSLRNIGAPIKLKNSRSAE